MDSLLILTILLSVYAILSTLVIVLLSFFIFTKRVCAKCRIAAKNQNSNENQTAPEEEEHTYETIDYYQTQRRRQESIIYKKYTPIPKEDSSNLDLTGIDIKQQNRNKRKNLYKTEKKLRIVTKEDGSTIMLEDSDMQEVMETK